MKLSKNLVILSSLIGLLALVASAAGLFWQTSGQPYPSVTFRGEAVTIMGHGLYRYDTLSSAAQEQGQDAVTLAVALPVLVISLWLASRGSLRGKLLLTGTLAYFLYTYMMMAFETAYNPFFLVYVALFSLSLFAFILSMLSFDLATLPQHFSARLPRRAIAAVLFTAGGFLFLAWMGRIVSPLLQNTTPALENSTTLVIQAMDLGILVPLTFLSGVLLLRRSAWGYLLASVAVLKFLTYGIAVCSMGINMILSGVGSEPVLLGVFFTLTVVNLVLAGLLLKNIDAEQEAVQPV